MKALSIIGLVMSFIGIITAIYTMTAIHGESDEPFAYLATNPVSQSASSAGLVMLLTSVFFLVFSIISAVISFAKKGAETVTPSLQQANPQVPNYSGYGNYAQQNPQPYGQQYPNPYGYQQYGNQQQYGQQQDQHSKYAPNTARPEQQQDISRYQPNYTPPPQEEKKQDENPPQH